MSKEKNRIEGNTLYTLIPLEEFKAVLGIDDREDKIARFCLVTSTLTIEQYCKRRLLRKKHFERIEFCGDLVLPLREYPISKMLAVYVLGNGEIVESEFYRIFINIFPQYFCLSKSFRLIFYITYFIFLL
jgi:hypothetical protein